MPRKYNNSFAKLRCGVAPLKIETGRYEKIELVLIIFVMLIIVLRMKNTFYLSIQYMQICVVIYLNMLVFIIIILCSYLMMKNLYFYSLMKTCVFILPKSDMIFNLKENVFYIDELLIVHIYSLS